MWIQWVTECNSVYRKFCNWFYAWSKSCLWNIFTKCIVSLLTLHHVMQWHLTNCLFVHFVIRFLITGYKVEELLYNRHSKCASHSLHSLSLCHCGINWFEVVEVKEYLWFQATQNLSFYAILLVFNILNPFSASASKEQKGCFSFMVHSTTS